ncbi:MAG: peptidoglycan DD-metalloendopeptidase family protein [Devosiaceae bacterium]|nr:peptidoglycan DD-metalloendopeptidase family protein [Devosiaceae bacterium]
MIRQLIINSTNINPSQKVWDKVLLALIFALIFAGFFITISLAQENNAPSNVTKDIRLQIKEIESSIFLGQEQSEILQKEMADIAKDRTKLTAALIASGQRVKLAEIEVGALEENLSELLSQKNIIEKRLAGTNKDISSLLAALQRLGRSPAPALLVDPTDALSSARSAILISAILPQLQSQAAVVNKDLQALNNIRQKALDEEDAFRANLETLANEQLRIALLVEVREKEISTISTQLEQETIIKQELANKAKSLEELITNINAQETLNATNLDNSVSQLPASTPKEIALAYANISRTSPAIPFEKAKGYLAIPASGVVVSKFGANDGLGGISKGISIVTRADAQVVAPNDGWVIYKGPYLNYGQIIIIKSGNGFTMLLAGLKKTNVELGQFLLRGEPVGVMGSRTIGQEITTNAGILRPTLYIELRKLDIPLDPNGWWEDKYQINQTG